MKRLILVALIILVAGHLICNDITEDQVRAWWGVKTEEEKIDVLLKYATIINGKPVINLPDYFAVFVENDIIVIPQNTGTIKIGHLEYEFTLKEMTFNDLILNPKPNYTGHIIIGGICALAGLVVGFFLCGGK